MIKKNDPRTKSHEDQVFRSLGSWTIRNLVQLLEDLEAFEPTKMEVDGMEDDFPVQLGDYYPPKA